MRLGLSRIIVGVICALITFANCNRTSAAVVLIDLNELGGVGGPGGTWNTYNTPGNINGSTVVDTSNQPTPITFSVLAGSTIADNVSNSGPTNVFNPLQAGFENLPAWVAAGGNGNAGGDNFFTSTTSGTFQFTLVFGGLTAGNLFSLDILASRNASNTGNFDYSLDNGTTWTGFRVLNADGTVAMTNGWDTNDTATQAFNLQSQGYVLHRYMNASNVSLTGTTLQVRTTDSSGTGFSAINAMQLSVTAIPEPSTYLWGVVTLCGLGIYCRSRQRKLAAA